MTSPTPDTEAASRNGQSQSDRERLQLGIGGMSCSFCTSSIQKAYQRMDGVDDVAVSLSHEEGLITYDPDRVTEDQLKDRLREIGYSVRDPDKLRRFAEEEAELREAHNGVLVGGAFSAAVLGLMAAMLVTDIMWPLLPFVLAAMSFVTVFVVGSHIVRMAWTSLRNGILNQHVLLEFGAIGGLAGGVGAMIAPDVFTVHHLFGPMTGVAEFFGAATLITTYHLLSQWVSLRLRTRTSQAVRQLLELQPDTARVVRDGRGEERGSAPEGGEWIEIEVPTAEVAAGDLVRIRPGESVPIDGVVREGHSAVDQSLVTGEAIPEEKVVGDEVVGGSLNQAGTLLVEVTVVGDESFLSRVARDVEEARALKPGLLQLVDRILQVYVPGVLLIAGGAFAFWVLGAWALTGQPHATRGLFAALAVGVMGYPCALGMATPLAMIRGGGMAAERGILMRSGEAFQVFGELTDMVFDKTGTVTEGRPEVSDVVAADDEAELLTLAASAESSSEHPLARAVVDAARRRGHQLRAAEDFTAHTGSGVEARVEGRRVLIGKPAFLAEWGVDLGGLAEPLGQLESQGKTTIAAADDKPLGLIAVADMAKADAAEAVARTAELGMTPIMVTGDNERTARAVAAEVGIEEVVANVRPEDKAARIRELQAAGRRVGMVGDGINDAPALMQADVGIAIGAGTDIAIESSDVVIMGDRLAAVPDTYEISDNSYRKTKQNLAIAFVFNGVGVPAAATGLVSPVFAMLAMIASVTGVLANSFAGRLLAGGRLSSGRDEVAGQLLARRQGSEAHDHDADQPKEPAAAAAAPQPDTPASPATAAPQPDTPASQVTLSVPDIHCEHCASRIERGLTRADDVAAVTVDADAKTVRVRFHPDRLLRETAAERLRTLGYEPEGDQP